MLSVRLLIAVFPIIVSLITFVVGQENCTEYGQYSVEYESGRCILVEKIWSMSTQGQARDQCRRLTNATTFVWDLVKLDTKPKLDAFANAVRLLPHPLMKPNFWLGLVRDLPETMDEHMNATRWADASKWRWVLDNTTVERSMEAAGNDSFPGEWDENEPDNNSPVLETCVEALWSERDDRVSWKDRHCDWVISTDAIWVCESSPVPEPTTTTTTSEPTMSMQTTRESIEISTTTNSSDSLLKNPTPGSGDQAEWSWQWIALGSGLGAIVVCLIALGAFVIVRRRRRVQRRRIERKWSNASSQPKTAKVERCNSDPSRIDRATTKKKKRNQPYTYVKMKPKGGGGAKGIEYVYHRTPVFDSISTSSTHVPPPAAKSLVSFHSKMSVGVAIKEPTVPSVIAQSPAAVVQKKEGEKAISRFV